MDSSAFEQIEQSCKALKVDLSSREMAVFAEQNALTPEQLKAVADLFRYLEEKKHQTVIDTLLRLSRLPIKAPKTFANYDFDRIHGKDAICLRNLPALSEIHAGKTWLLSDLLG